MKIVVSGGKTGGHLIPGIAVYEEMKKRNVEVLYVMSAFDTKFPIVSIVKEEDRFYLELQKISRQISLKTPLYAWKILKAFFQVFSTIKKYNPDLVLITGGYISNPVALSAIILRKPLYIAEQNSVAGITNRFYAHFARKVFTTFPQTRKIPPKKAFLTGNPSIFHEKTVKTAAKAFFNLTKYEKILGITGGSQGALKMNDWILKTLPFLKEKKMGVIWSIGSVDYQRLEKKGEIAPILSKFPNVRIFQFIERMDHFYSCVDFVLSRAGATSLSEFLEFEVPSLLIPIYHSPDNHQYLNAKFLLDAGAALILEENELSLENLILKIERLFSHTDSFQRALQNLKQQLALKNPAETIADFILKDLHLLNF
jgi:UDP-N-acetylglucosamine--N-acetylmuramyl-(pentapeptide) pyrophosphoryl-undecaprenol N-acetylglucosamine transferase